MPSFAELKAKASKTTSSGVERLQNIKDRNTSVSMKSTNWDPYSGTAPPPPPPPTSIVNTRTKPAPPPLLPPPSRTGGSPASTSTAASSGFRAASNSSSPAPPLPSRTPSTSGPPLPKRSGQPIQFPPSRAAGLVPKPVAGSPPPPVARSTKPVLGSLEAFHAEDQVPVIDWANLSPEDKAAFFSWLDEFFSGYLNISIPPRTDSKPSRPTGNLGGPPPLKAYTKPTSWMNPVHGSTDSTVGGLVLSHPPAAIHGSAAADLAEFFKPSTKWNDPWYHRQSAIPPPLEGNTQIRYTFSWQSIGNTKTTTIGVLFSDLSIFWGSVQYAMNDPENERHIKREAYHLSRPISPDQIKLTEASEMYGDSIASFAETFLGTNECCGRGECWDLASEALKYFDNYDYIPKPVPSISRTHGCLIFEGRASNKGGNMVGRWRGGDDRIRRGDIVEWRKVRLATIGSRGGYSILGDPDHTAVIVNETVPLVNVSNGSSIRPSELGTLTVVEQSLGQPPMRRDYNLQGLEEGEVWIYRPISMEVYLGIHELTPTPPESSLSTLHSIS